MHNIKLETSRHFRNKEKEYLEDKISKLATNSKGKNIRDLCRGINECKKGYQPRNNLVKDENGDLLADFYNILNRWKNYFSELLIRDPSPFELETAVIKLKKYKSPGSDQILAQLIEAGGETLRSETHKLINYIWNKE
jgi:hypothetical protein